MPCYQLIFQKVCINLHSELHSAMSKSHVNKEKQQHWVPLRRFIKLSKTILETYKETYKGKEKHVLFILMVLEIVSLRLSLSGVFLGSLSWEVYYRHHTSGLGEMVDGKGTKIPFWNIHMGGLSSRVGNWR